MPIWNELSWPQIKECADRGQVVIIPAGVVEQHGFHLPVDTDAFLAEAVAREAAKLDPEIMVAPTIAHGFTPSNKHFPGSISLRASTWMALVRDIIHSIARHGFTRIAILNGHGGQIALGQTIVQVLQEEDGISLVLLSWFTLVDSEIARLFSDEGLRGARVGHAGAVETSMNLHLRPELAHQGELQANVVPWMPEYVTSVGGYVQTPRMGISPSGVIGDPHLATAEKGAELFNLAADRLCAFAREFRISAPELGREEGSGRQSRPHL